MTKEHHREPIRKTQKRYPKTLLLCDPYNTLPVQLGASKAYANLPEHLGLHVYFFQLPKELRKRLDKIIQRVCLDQNRQLHAPFPWRLRCNRHLNLELSSKFQDFPANENVNRRYLRNG